MKACDLLWTKATLKAEWIFQYTTTTTTIIIIIIILYFYKPPLPKKMLGAVYNRIKQTSKHKASKPIKTIKTVKKNPAGPPDFLSGGGGRERSMTSFKVQWELLGRPDGFFSWPQP